MSVPCTRGPRGGALTVASFFVGSGFALRQKNKKEIIREDSNCPGHCEAVWDSWLLDMAAKDLSLLHNPVRPLDSSVSRRLRKASVGPCSQTHTKACFCTAWISQWDGRMHQWGNSVGSEGWMGRSRRSLPYLKYLRERRFPEVILEPVVITVWPTERYSFDLITNSVTSGQWGSLDPRVTHLQERWGTSWKGFYPKRRTNQIQKLDPKTKFY